MTICTFMYAKQECSSNFNICNVVRHANQNEGQEKGLAACDMYVTHGDGSGLYGLLKENRRDIVGHKKYVTIIKKQEGKDFVITKE